MTEIASILRRLHTARADERFVLATLVRVAGSSYRRTGARMLLGAEGSRLGSISGGCLEDDTIIRARRVLSTGIAETITYDTTSENDLVWGVGLGCHGVVDILIERVNAHPSWSRVLADNLACRANTTLSVVWRAPRAELLGTRLVQPGDDETSTEGFSIFVENVRPPTPLVIVGAGDDAQPLCRIAATLGFSVIVVDHRPAYGTAERFPEADAVLTGSPTVLASQLPLDERAAVVVMTHHYVHDLPWMRTLLPMPLAYLGLLGPKQRAEKILADIAAIQPVAPAMRARLHAPVGLDLGARTPEEVALAILAEITAALRGRDARPLRERTRPIHDES